PGHHPGGRSPRFSFDSSRFGERKAAFWTARHDAIGPLHPPRRTPSEADSRAGCRVAERAERDAEIGAGNANGAGIAADPTLSDAWSSVLAEPFAEALGA